MKNAFAVTPRRLPAAPALTTLLAAASLAGCTITSGDGLFSGDRVDYRRTATNTRSLEVPPDLTQLARESRYQPQGGVVSAAAAGASAAPGAAATAATAAVGTPTVALASVGSVRVEREGQQRWLVVPQPPEQLWPRVKEFWEQHGFTLTTANAQTGVMETNWSENRARLPKDAVRNTVGSLLGNVYDSGERDSYRTRIERGADGGSEIYVSHRGVAEVYISERHDSTTWRARPNDPQLEAEMLAQLMLTLAPQQDLAAAAAAVAAAPETPGRGRAAAAATMAGGPPPANAPTTMVVNEPFDRAWRRVGLALDRGGFTVEDRDRSSGLYYVRYVDPRNAGKEEPGWWARLFGDKSNPQQALRYRIALKTEAGSTTVSVQTSAGAPETGENARRIVALLTNELR